jgi:hypothetical protein
MDADILILAVFDKLWLDGVHKFTRFLGRTSVVPLSNPLPLHLRDAL